MRAKWTSMLIVIAILLQGTIGVRGQEIAKNNSITDLKEQIARLVKIERDESVPAEVKTLNNGFLEERRAQLRVLLQKRVNALRNYHAAVGSALTPGEIKIVENSIRELEKDLQGLQSEVPQPVSPASPVHLSVASFTPIERGGNIANTPVSPKESGGRFIPPTQVADLPEFRLKGSDPDPASQNVIRDDVRRQLANVVREISKATTDAGRREAMDITANPQLYSELLALILTNSLLTREEFVKDIEAARIDKQVGGTAGSTGSTTLVSKGGTPAVLGFAVENGGLTREIDGTAVTFRGNPVGLIESFQKEGFIPSYKDSQSTQLLRKLSFSLTFDTSQGDMPGTLLANRQQLSSYSLRYEFKNDRDPRNEKYKARWEGLVRGNKDRMVAPVQSAVNTMGNIQRFLDTHPAYVEWRKGAGDSVANARADELPDVIARAFEAFQAIEPPPQLITLVESFQTDFTAYRQERSKLLDIVANAPIFTLEYVNNRRPSLIDTSTMNFIAETGLFEGKADLTYNGSFTFFNASPGAGMKRLRNFDNSLRLDVPIGDLRRFGGFLTFAGQYKRLMEDDMTANGMMMNTKGDMATGQLLFTIPIKGTGFKIPISLSFANRTEFVKEREVRGNFGFTFDLDSILQKVKPF